MVDKRPENIQSRESDGLLQRLAQRIFYVHGGEAERVPIKVTAIYLVVGALWILLSDKVLALLVYDKEKITYFSMVKGWMYVAVTGILIYTLVYNSFRRIKSTENDLVNSNRNLFATNKKLELAYEQLAASQEDLKRQYEQSVKSQLRLKENEERYRLISEAANDAIWEEIEGVRIFSDRWFEITGYTKEDLDAIGNWETLIHPVDKMAARQIMLEHKQNMTPYYRCEYRLKVKSGEYKWIQARGKALLNDKGQVCRMAGSHTDITELKEYELRLQYLAYHDQLTGLKNRFALNERLNTLIRENKNTKCALLFIDVDNFKYVNDTMGHTFGDLLLVKVSERLINLEEGNWTVYRLGGDEFIVLAEDFRGREEIERLAVSILKGFKYPLEVENSSIVTTVSIGISIYPDHGADMDALLKSADIAVYKAKETGKNRIVFYNEPMNEAVAERVSIERHLRTALENSEFELYYQPQLDIDTSKISGFEALIRWNNPELGFVSPQKFICVAEDTLMIIQIGEWVLRSACIFLKKLHQQGYKHLNISINISILQLLQDDFIDIVMDTIESVRLNPEQVELEITESILMESYEAIAGKLKLLRASGIKIALDDFGKGYSSLNYLRQLPITTLKIDKTFIDTISNTGRNKSLTDFIVKIGRSMDLCVVAEGVESQEQMDYLIEHKCSKIQGYLFSKPLIESEAIKRLERGENKSMIDNGRSKNCR